MQRWNCSLGDPMQSSQQVAGWVSKTPATPHASSPIWWSLLSTWLPCRQELPRGSWPCWHRFVPHATSMEQANVCWYQFGLEDFMWHLHVTCMGVVRHVGKGIHQILNWVESNLAWTKSKWNCWVMLAIYHHRFPISQLPRFRMPTSPRYLNIKVSTYQKDNIYIYIKGIVTLNYSFCNLCGPPPKVQSKDKIPSEEASSIWQGLGGFKE